MTNLLKKSDRLNILTAYFEKLTAKGYTQETYKDLNIFTKFENDRYHLDVYKGTSTKNLNRYYYRTNERMQQVINNYKSNTETRENRKAEEKNNPTLSTHSNCAKAIREELKLNFPNYKFSVTSESFSGGNSVHISWNNGATVKQVDRIVNKYQYGHFNGMDDMYEYSNNIEGLPQVKFISTSRTVTEDLLSRLEIDFKNFYNNADVNDFDHWSIKNVVRRMLYKLEIVNAENIKGWKQIQDSGSIEDCYVFLLFEEETKKEVKTETAQPQTGKINIIDYSEKAIAVIGDTKPLKEVLKSLGGSFNPRLNCGCGWIFSKKKLEEVQNALIKYANENKQKEEVKAEILALPAHEQTAIIEQIQEVEAVEEINTFLQLDYFKILWHEGRHIEGATFENTTFTTWYEVQKAFLKLWEVNEKGQDGGYSKVKCEIKLKGQEAQIDRIDITNKIENGDFNPSQENICEYIVKHCDYLIHRHDEQEQQVKIYTNIKDITTAVSQGEQISLFNLSQIINNKTINA